MVGQELGPLHLRMDVLERLALNLRRLRHEAGLSQEELSELSNIHQTYLSGLEGGKRNPSIRVLDRLASALKVDISVLLGRHDPRT